VSFLSLGTHSGTQLSLCTANTMSGYYPPNANLPPQYYNVNPNVVPNPNVANAPPMMAPDGSYAHGIPESPIYHSMPGSFVPYADPQMQQSYIGQYEEVPGAMDSTQGSIARIRRRPGPGDQVKHRRTRSGCYTCRQRRVKVSLSPTWRISVHPNYTNSATRRIQCAIVSARPAYSLTGSLSSFIRMSQGKSRMQLPRTAVYPTDSENWHQGGKAIVV
jgi:hypothetical protein